MSEDLLVFLRAPRTLARRPLAAYARQIRQTVAGGRGFLCLVTDDRELQRLNRQFLGKDEPTDVLSFPEPGPGGFLGEMAVSAGRAREQARSCGHSLEAEIRILMLHGLLHLLGMDHTAGRSRMARAEKRWREELGLPAGLIERARA